MAHSIRTPAERRRTVMPDIVRDSIPAAAPPTASRASEIDDHRENQEHEVKRVERTVVVHQPRIDDRSQREKNETEERNQEAMIGAVDVVRQKEQQPEHDPRKREDENEQDARHP